MRWLGAGIFLALLFIAVTAPAQADDDRRACTNISYRPLEITVPACTRLIEKGNLEPGDLRLMLRRRADAYYFGSSLVSSADERKTLLARALGDINRAIALEPGPAPAQTSPFWLGPLELARADVLLELGRSKQAADAYTAAMDSVPGAASYARLGRALAYANLERFDDALADVTALMQAEPAQAKWALLRGEINEKAGRRDAAIADYEAVLQIDPEHVGARQALERLGGTGRDD